MSDPRAALANEIARAGMLIRERACRAAVTAAMVSGTPASITHAQMETRMECCGGRGYHVTLKDGRATVTPCSCLTVRIATRL